MTNKSLLRRLSKLDKRDKVGTATNYSVWVNEGDGIMRQGSQTMTRQAFEATFPDAITIALKLFERDLRDLKVSEDIKPPIDVFEKDHANDHAGPALQGEQDQSEGGYRPPISYPPRYDKTDGYDDDL